MSTTMPKFQIPTGYEAEQRDIERRRKIAEALMSQGLQARNDMTSPWQALAQVGQAISGALINRKADRMQGDYDTKVRQAWDEKTTEFNNDSAGGLDPQAMINKWGNDPMMVDRVAPYADAIKKRLAEKENLITHNGMVGTRLGDVAGQYEQGKPTDYVLRNTQTGAFEQNPTAIDAAARVAAAQQGYEPMTALPGQAAPAQASAPGQKPEALTMDMVTGLRNSLGPQGAIQFLTRNKIPVRVNTPEEAKTLPPGTPVILPDGREGTVN